MRAKMYISGKITGKSRCAVETDFSRGVLVAVRNGYIPYNPLNNGLPRRSPWLLHMVVDIITMLQCDAVLMLHDWEDSKGARIEHYIAQAIGKYVCYES